MLAALPVTAIAMAPVWPAPAEAKDAEIASLRSQLQAARSQINSLKGKAVESPLVSMPSFSESRTPSFSMFPGMPMFPGLPNLFGDLHPTALGGGAHCKETTPGTCECTIVLPPGDTTEAGDVDVNANGKKLELTASDKHAGRKTSASVKHGLTLTFAPKHVDAVADRGGKEGDVLRVQFGPKPENATCDASSALSSSDESSEAADGSSSRSSSSRQFSSSPHGFSSSTSFSSVSSKGGLPGMAGHSSPFAAGGMLPGMGADPVLAPRPEQFLAQMFGGPGGGQMFGGPGGGPF